MGWSNYLFEPSPPNPVVEGPTGALIFSSGTDIDPGTFFGDGSWGEMGVSLLTILTAAHRKRLVLNSYFGSATATPPGWAGQPAPSVGFYSIAVGDQPSTAAQDLINATMNPIDANINKINWDIRNTMDDLLASRFGPPPGSNIFKLNPWDPAGSPVLLNGFDGKMGDLLRAFAAPSPLPIAFNVSRRQAMDQYIWDRPALQITNTATLTMDEIRYADLFATATNLTELNNIFRRIITSIQMEGVQNIVTAVEHEEKSFDGYLSFSDVLGEYMQVRSVGNLFYNDVEYSRTGFAEIADNATLRNNYINILHHHMNYGTPTNHPLYLQADTVASLVARNIANPDFRTHPSIKYYANTNRDFVGNFFNLDGTPAGIPADAAAIVEVFPMWGDINPTSATPAPPSGTTNLRLITFHVITALRNAAFAELYASNSAGDPMTRVLNAGDQMIRWYIPSDLIPIRTPVFVEATPVNPNPANLGALIRIDGNIHPIRVEFTVGLNRERVSTGIPWEKFVEYQVPGTNDQMWFYSDRHNPNPTNVTLAFFRPHPNNPFYIGVGGIDTRGVNKTQNVTQTAPHVSLNRLIAYTANANYDMHWLGNNGRLTMRLVPPPTPDLPPSPQTGVRSFVLPIVIFMFGAAVIGTAEIYRRKSKKKQQ
jgi:hypothetical protein